MTPRKKTSRSLEKKRESRDSALLRGTEELAALGLDLATLEPTAESVRRLVAVEASSSAASRAIACWLGFAPIPEAAQALVDLEGTAGDKELKREIRRSIFRLEQRGVKVPSRPESGEGPQRGPKTGGYLSAVDGSGEQVVWYLKEEGSGDYFIISGVISTREGMVDSNAGRVARSALSDLLHSTRAKYSIRLLPADAAYCDLILHEAYRNSSSKQHRRVASFPSYRMEITHRIPERKPCPVLEVLEEKVIQQMEELLASTGKLLEEEEEFKGWAVDPDWLKPHLEAFREIHESPIVLNSYQQEEREEKALAEANRILFEGPARDSYQNRLERMAYYFLLDEREPVARQTLAVSIALRPGGSQDPASIPFLSALLRRSLPTTGEAKRPAKPERDAGSLIVRPGEP